ncbi:MAG: signal peptidase I [Porticoccaceae bacterium]|nr:signal peptidase I [Porticoccaceae bacterium]
MNFNFELILTVLFILTALFWIINHCIVKKQDGFVEFIASMAPVLGIVLLLRSFIVEPFQIPSKSMVPNLLVGDFILVNKFAYGLRLPVLRYKFYDFGKPQRGDVMVFFPPHDDRYFIKRLIGLPGDEVRVIEGVVYINGRQISQKVSGDSASTNHIIMNERLSESEHKIQKRLSPTRLSMNHTAIVPDGHFFMLGDNRDNSSDSRVWGPVPEDRLVGKAFARWMFWDKFLSLPSFRRVGWLN